MKLQTAYLSYINLTPNFENKFFHSNHKEIINILRKYFNTWEGFFIKYSPDFSIGFMVLRKEGTDKLIIKGPSISKKMKIVDFSIFLPDEIIDLSHYIDLIFEGFNLILCKYKVSETEVNKMKNECKKELSI
jgi:hypothetical protein